MGVFKSKPHSGEPDAIRESRALRDRKLETAIERALAGKKTTLPKGVKGPRGGQWV